MVREISRAQAMAEKHGAPEAYDNLQSLVASPNVDAVYICTPVSFHSRHTLAAAAAGKHVLCEKPMGLTVEECRVMIDACRSQGVILGIGYMVRFRAAVRRLKAMIEAGELGGVVSGRAQTNIWYPPGPGRWRYLPDLSGGGALMDLGAHCVDTLRDLIGEVVEVQALASSARMGAAVEDTLLGAMRFENGALGQIDCSFSVPHRECPLEIFGTKRSVTIARALGGFEVPEMTVHDGVASQRVQIDAVDPYIVQFDQFSQAIRDNQSPEVDGAEGLRNTSVIQALYRAAEQGEPVRVASEGHIPTGTALI
jgi:1,5-anhydro-D-fructose reductase (1,5-anhydro-D-mannitol-forming)